MKALFCYDGPLRIDEHGNYYGVALNDEMFSRYYSIFDDLTLITRTINIRSDEISNRFSKITLKNIHVKHAFNLASINGIIFKYSKVKKKIIEEMKNVDCLIVRLPSLLGIIGIKIAHELRKPYYVEIVGYAFDSLWHHSLKGKLLALPIDLLMKRAIVNAPYTLYVTNNFLQRMYPCKGITIGCSDVFLPLVDENIQKKRLKKIAGMKGDQPLIVGTIAPLDVKYKGQKYVIEAISRLNKEGYNFEYHLVGGGDNSYLKNVAKKYRIYHKVKFMGSLSHEAVFEYLDNIDIYIQPSKTEGLPRSLVEAMSRGCPSLGSAVGGIPELLNKEVTFSSGAVDELCNILKKLDKDMLIRESRRNFEEARKYENTKLDKKRNEFYKEIISSLT